MLKINDRFRNRTVKFFNDFKFSLRYDSIASTFSFNYYFDPNNPEHKELSCVTHFHEVTLEYDGELILTGVIVSQKFKRSTTKQLAQFSGYSLPGVLEDCQIPPSIYPLQSDGLSLVQIARKLINPFKKNYGLEMVVDPAVSSIANKVIKNTIANETQTIKDYLTTIASQKNIVLTHDERGRLLITKAKTESQSVYEFDLTNPTLVGFDFEIDYNGQDMHSHITVQKQASIDGGNAGQFTIRNPYVIGSVYRPKVMTQTSGDDNDTSLAARRELAKELRNLTLKIETDRWGEFSKILRPNNIITVFDPELYLYKKVRWFIESIEFEGNNTKNVATITCRLPECYNDKTPVSIYTNINLHAQNE